MITHYLKVAFRNLVKYKTQTLISIIGLSVGFTCFALSVLWIRYEMTYDNFHEGADRIYLAGDKFDLQGDGFSYYSSSLLADYIMKNCPEVEKACHIIQKNIIPIEYEKNVYQTQQLRVDSNFVSIFNIIVLEGSNRMRLENNQIAITDKIAKQIFGTESPIGKQFIFPNTNNTKMTIVAVVKSWEGHSLYPFDILLPKHKSNLHLSGWFYKGSVSFQLFVSIGLVFCTMVMMKQLDYLLNSKELGLNRHNIGVIASGYGFEGVPFKEILEQMPDVIECLYGFYTPIPKMSFYSYEVREWEGQADKEQRIKLEKETINQDYANFFQVEVLEGNMLDEKDGKEAVLINEAAAKAFGWDHPIGKKIHLNEKCIVKGVIKNIYYNAPIHPVTPAIFFLPDNKQKSENRGHLIFKFKEGTWKNVSQKLREEAYKVNPNAELRLINMEEKYDEYMKSENSLSMLLSIVSFICIAIAVFGIFSLVTLSCEQRRKEIAIRKVNGASIGTILNLFFKEYLLLLIIASCIAFPLGYVIMKHWLESYVKQTPISLWIYGGIFIVMLLIIFLSIIWRVWKAARQNPAEVIKSE